MSKKNFFKPSSSSSSSSFSKKLINKPGNLVEEGLRGLVLCNSGLISLPNQPFSVLRSDWSEFCEEGKVSVIIGGGSGHEPCWAGYVGVGMATAAIHGQIFAAPSSNSIYQLINCLSTKSKSGILVLFCNYTGDRLNFGSAIEKAKSRGIKIDSVIHADDCCLGDGWQQNQRRGLAGFILLLKVIGPLAEEGKNLEYLVDMATKTSQNIASVGVAWSPCSLPSSRAPLFHLPPDQMEFGLGIHGESGIKRVEMQTCKETVGIILKQIFQRSVKPSLTHIHKEGRVVVLLNNLGATSELEIYLLAWEVLSQLNIDYHVTVDRIFSGRFVTSLEMAGISISIMNSDDFIVDCLDKKTKAVGWQEPNNINIKNYSLNKFQFSNEENETETKEINKEEAWDKKENGGPVFSEDEHKLFLKCITSICNNIISNKDLLNHWDSGVGDGDCGDTLAAGANALYKLLRNDVLSQSQNVCHLIDIMGAELSQSMGGTSGGIYSLMLSTTCKELKKMKGKISNQGWVTCLRKSIETVVKYGGAKPGSRSLIDPLNAACVTMENPIKNKNILEMWKLAMMEAEEEMIKTREMEAKVGRGTNIPREILLKNPDPGAKAVCIWMNSVINCLNDNKSIVLS